MKFMNEELLTESLSRDKCPLATPAPTTIGLTVRASVYAVRDALRCVLRVRKTSCVIIAR